MPFKPKLQEVITRNKSMVCVGLDIDPAKLPPHLAKNTEPLWEFNKNIIDATIDLVCAYKPNSAFYEAEGEKGLALLRRTIKHIAGRVPVILDVKRGDIGNTAKAYARSAFEELGADAVTLSPYMGLDSLEPFLTYTEKGIFILCLTSNPGAADFQKPDLYKKVAEKALEWNKRYGNIGLVVGATNSAEIKEVRGRAPGLPFLVPGVGAQGGSVQEVLKFSLTALEDLVLINSSRGILYASSGRDFAEAAREETRALRDEINSYIPKV
jgi:orotidine-5'-phosphate decarboxylase